MIPQIIAAVVSKCLFQPRPRPSLRSHRSWPELQTELMRNRKASKVSGSPKLWRWTGRNIYRETAWGGRGKGGAKGTIHFSSYCSVRQKKLQRRVRGLEPGALHSYCHSRKASQSLSKCDPYSSHWLFTASSLFLSIKLHYRELNYIWHFPLECSLHINCAQAEPEQ